MSQMSKKEILAERQLLLLGNKFKNRNVLSIHII